MFEVKMSFISPKELRMPREVLHDLSNSGIYVDETEDINDVLDYVDVLYVTRIQKGKIS